MLWRSNKRKNSADPRPEGGVSPARGNAPAQQAGGDTHATADMTADTSGQAPESAAPKPEDAALGGRPAGSEADRKALLMQNEDARRMFQGLQDLRKSVHSLKNAEESITSAQNGADGTGSAGMEESAELRAAHKAIVEQARKDAQKEREKRREALQREMELKKQEQKALEAQRHAAMIEKEAERKRREALEAEKRARDVMMKQALDTMGMEFKESEEHLDAVTRDPEAAREVKQRIEAIKRAGADSSAAAQIPHAAPVGMTQEPGVMTGRTETPAQDPAAEKYREAVKQAELDEVGEILEAQRRKIEALKTKASEKEFLKKEKDILRRERKLAAEARNIAEKERARAAKEQKNARRLAERKAEKERREKKHAEKLAEKERKAELRKKREADAELGGGIVRVKGVEINTKVNKLPTVSLKDFLGFRSRAEKKAATPEEQAAIQRDREERREKAREAAARLSHIRKIRYEKSSLGRKMKRFKEFCEEHKKPLLLAFSILLTITVGVAGVFNYCTAYEYSYNGRHLGYVKEKDTVLRITDLVQGALTEDKNLDVVIDAKDDITFKRVPIIGSSITPDSSDEVLKRLTYMGDVNVKAYGIYVNGSKMGAVESKDTAAAVLQDIKDRYTSDYEVSEIEEAVFIEKVEVKKSNTPLQDVVSEEAMVERLCTSGEKDSVHKVLVGETLADIAKLYSMTEDELLEDNKNVDPKKLEVGSTLTIKQNAPVLTVKITEMVTYDKVVEHEVEKKKTKDIYKGDKETKQKGKDGLNEITARITTVNGEVIEEDNLVTTVKKEPVKEIILVGTKKRPATVGSGKFAWPASGGYTLTSNFGSRWGRTHEGIDLGCSVGTDVLASDGGTVTVAGYSGAYGYLVEIDHQNGMVTRYGHNSSVLVNVGDKVYKGQHIAESGNTGRSTGPHIHFEIRVNGTAQNPLNYLP